MRFGIGLGLFKQGAVSVGVRLFSAYKSRVIADGGTVEADNCGISALNNSLFQQASLLLIPSGYKSGKAYAEIPTNGNGDLTWTRASDAWRTNADGLIQRVPWNLLQYSEDFSNVNWVKLNSSTITANTTTAPNGTLTADTYQASNLAFGGICRGSAAITITSGQTYTFSFFAKKNNYRYVGIRFNTSINIQRFPNYDFDTDTLNKQGVTCDLTRTLLSDGWVRIVLTYTTTSTAGTCDIGLTTSNGDTATALAGTEKVDIWGAQLVEGSSAQTYFPTTDRLNVPRLSYMYGSCPALLLEPQRTNSIRNSIASGAVVGTPGTRPTNWEYTATAGLTIDIIQLGTIGALNYIDYRISGTATATSARLSFELSTQIAATVGQTWSYSLYAQSLTGSLPSSLLRFVERNSAGGALVTGDQAISVSSSFERFAYTRTTTNASCAYIVPELNFSVTSGTSYNFTFRIAQPQIELGAYATTPILTTGSASATRIADSFSRNNIYTNGLITSSGGTWFVELRNNISYTRDAGSTSLAISTTSADVFAGSTGIEILANTGLNRLSVIKRISGTATTLYLTTTDTVKIAVKWNGTSADVFVNGTKQVSATSFTTTNMEFLKAFGVDVPKFIQAMGLHPTPLTDAQCIELTTL